VVQKKETEAIGFDLPKRIILLLAFAAALTFASVLAFASVRGCFATALAFAGILAFAAFAVHWAFVGSITAIGVATSGQSHGSSEHSCHCCGYDYFTCCLCHTIPFRFVVLPNVLLRKLTRKN